MWPAVVSRDRDDPSDRRLSYVDECACMALRVCVCRTCYGSVCRSVCAGSPIWFENGGVSWVLKIQRTEAHGTGLRNNE